MSDIAITFGLVDGVKISTGRGIGFLNGHSQLSANDAFVKVLNEKSRRAILTYMDAWIDYALGPKNRFHGFPGDNDYKNCFVFKVKQHNQGQRLYGYLCHPCPKTNPSFQICVLCIHAEKNEHETDRAELSRVDRWSQDERAAEAIKKIYSDEISGSKRGVAVN